MFLPTFSFSFPFWRRGEIVSDWGSFVQNDTELERVSKKSLKSNDTCPICGLAFLDG